MRKTLLVCLILGSLGILSMLSPAPVLAGVGLSPTTLSFGSITVNNTSTSATVVVSNGGHQSVSIVQISSSLPQFIVTGPSLPLMLAPHGSVYFHVQFRPDAVATYSGTIAFQANPQNGNVRTVSVSGTGTAAPLSLSSTYLLSPSPSSLSFPATLVGTSASQAVSLTNTGTGNVTISQISFSGTGFAVSGFTGTVTLAPGQSLALAVSFSPAVAGSAAGSLTVVSSATNSPTTIALSGTGVQPQISVIPASTNFGNATVGSANTQTFTISNPGTANLSISQAMLAGTGFGYSGLTLPLSVPPGGSSSFTVKFAPASAGSFSGNLTLVNNTPNSPFVIALSGTGISATLQLTASPTSLSFGSLTTGTSATQSVTLTNTGNSDISISQNTMIGSGFSVTGMALPLTLSTGQSTSFSTAFAPTTAGNFSGTVTVTSTATNSPTTISLSGSATAPVSHTTNLNWTPGSSPITGFNIYRGSSSGGPYTRINSAMISNTTFTDSSVAAGQTYYYVATEVDTAGMESAYSNETAAVIP